MHSKLFRTLGVLVVLAMVLVPVAAQGYTPRTRDDGAQAASAYKTDGASSEPATYILLFDGPSLVASRGGVAALGLNSADDQAYLTALADQRTQTMRMVNRALGRSLSVGYVYDVILNGVSAEMTAAEAEKAASVPGVRKVLKDRIEQVTTDAGPTWIGAPTIWTGSAVPSGTGTLGEGLLVGILDTGINFNHPSFSATPQDGYTYTWSGNYLGVCAPGGGQYVQACNNKLVGAWTFTKDTENVTPEDAEGHGSHTASTVAGNFVDMVYSGLSFTISGVAPHAQIIAYDVCDINGCAWVDSAAAVQQAILDGVDAINYSISGGEDPYNDLVELAFLEAHGAGVVVSTSAGNAGPTPTTVAHRSPWVLSTAATTHNRKIQSLVDFSNPLYTNLETLAGLTPFMTDVVDSPVKWSGDDGNLLGCTADGAFTPGFFAGAIAFIKRGVCTFEEKVLNAAAAGATGVIIYTDDRPPTAMAIAAETVPAIMLDVPGTYGDQIAAWVSLVNNDTDLENDATVSISAYAAYYDDSFGDIMAAFSSRGPNTTFDVLKPDVGAPGVAILAAVADGQLKGSAEAEFDLYQGTSMASPHDAGSAILLKAMHPDWTPAMVQSALMLTAYQDLVKEDKVTPADPFDIGAGRIALEKAGLTGLVMNETYDNFVAAEFGDVKELNLASLYNSACVLECGWTRTFTSVAGVPATYTVDAPAWLTVAPASFTILPGASQEITISADVSALPLGEWQFATISFNTDDTHAGGKAITDVHLTAAVLPKASDLPGWVEFTTYSNNGSGTVPNLKAVEITDLTVDTYGFVKGQKTLINLAPDATNGDPFDDLSQVYYTLIPMDSGAARLVAEITASTAPDVDLFWGFDVNADGLPAEGELYDYSATGTAFEYLSQVGFPSPFYDVWVIVQNWQGSGTPTDQITLSIGLVPWAPVDPATMTVSGPETVAEGNPFNLTVAWQGIVTEEGDRLYGLFDAYADAAYAVNLGYTEVDVIREAGVNTPPVAADDAYTTEQDTVLTVDAPGVLANDTDADLDPLTAALVDDVANGTLVLSEDGSFVYTPDTGFVGTDTFTYKASDGVATSDTATVTITVTEVVPNTPPVAVEDAYEMDEDTVLTVLAVDGVLANDTDADGDELTAVLVTDVAHGTLVLAADGSFVYTPDADYFGTDTFTYVADDGQDPSNEVTVTITIKDVEEPVFFYIYLPWITN